MIPNTSTFVKYDQIPKKKKQKTNGIVYREDK